MFQCPQLFGVIVIFGTLCDALYFSGSDVVNLNFSNFDRLVKDSDQIWIVEFFAPRCGQCKSFAAEYSKAASALKGVVKVGAVNGDEGKSLGGQYNVKRFPTIKIIYGKTVKDYNGPRTAQGVVDVALKVVRSKVEARLGSKTPGGGISVDSEDVVELTDSNFDQKVLKSDEPWMVEFFAPWCARCKRLTPEWAKAASALKGKVKFGAVDATVHQSTARLYGVDGYPIIKFFPAGPKSTPVKYDGSQTANEIISWASDKADVSEIDNDEVLDEGCTNHVLCVISILPHILDCDSKCRNGS